MDWLASARTAKPAPDTMGDTASTPGVCAANCETEDHWSTLRRRWARGWMMAAVLSGDSVVWLAAWGGRITTWAWLPKVLSMMDACNWLISVVKKMITATPPVTPARISTVCMRPSRR